MGNESIKARVVAVCTSAQKGTRKVPQHSARILKDYGLADDAHAEMGTKRQVSLLAVKSIEKMKGLSRKLMPGDFGENLTIEGIDIFSFPVGTRLRIGNEVVLEITQIGKACHKGCAIFQEVGTCIMPREGVFAQVIEGGDVRAGDELEIQQG
ncbi:MAG TPA: MOSC domain-containing protein [Deltaproteobacteria bacterium]|nr:MOSC domain-containing protein [Deltaproteobacteria bacterium]HPJ92585.1 MOSC domain-containing protein [Deltaproteobacteria bacterium]